MEIINANDLIDILKQAHRDNKSVEIEPGGLVSVYHTKLWGVAEAEYHLQDAWYEGVSEIKKRLRDE